jgi:hypothetical protein
LPCNISNIFQMCVRREIERWKEKWF